MLEVPKPIEKCCRSCWRNLPLKSFGLDKRSKDGLQTRCRKCVADQVRGSDSAKSARFMHSYGITLGQHKQIYEDQEGRCALCGTWTPYRKIHTDHDHVTNKVRGLLCARCNLGLGHFGDNIEGLRQALEYLEGGK